MAQQKRLGKKLSRLALCLTAGLALAGCARGFDTVAEDAYKTDRLEGVVVQNQTEDDSETTGRPAPTNTPAPPLRVQYDVPETCEMRFASGNLSVTGTAVVKVPEGNAMPVYALRPVNFSKEQLDTLLAACMDGNSEAEAVFTVEHYPQGAEGSISWAFGSDKSVKAEFCRNGQVAEACPSLRINFERGSFEEVPEGAERTSIEQRGLDFLEKAGLAEDFVLGHISIAKTQTEKTLYVLDFRRQVRGIALMESFGYSDLLEMGRILWQLEGLRLGLDEDGVCYFCWESPVEVGEEVKAGALLPFPVIEQTMVTLLKKKYEATQTNVLTVGRLELCYRPRYQEGEGVLVPVWNLYGTQNKGAWEKLLLSVNAQTGESMPQRSRRGK